MSTQQNRRFDALVFIGRFQPPHRGHLNVLKSALSRAERVCVLIGSTDKPRTIKDPFSFDERRQMLASLFDASERDRVTIAPLQDSTYNDGDWVRWVQDAVASALGDIAQRKVGLIGHEKDATSYYLRMFPQWEFRRRRCDRRHFRHRDPRPVFRRTHQQLRAVGRAGTRVRLARAFPHAAGIRAAEVGGRIHRRVSQGVGGGSYPVTFVTVDAVVVHSGHILLVRRRSEPGRGLWALPGGFVNCDERLDAACIRELREETGLKLPGRAARLDQGSPGVRSPDALLRGRTITHACLFNFPTGELPRVKGSDDADKARWVPLNEFAQMRSVMFEDHFDIAYHFLGKL